VDVVAIGNRDRGVVVTEGYDPGMASLKGTPRPLLSVREVAEQFGVSRKTVYDWTNTGAIPSIKVGGTVRIPTRALVDRLALAASPGLKGKAHEQDSAAEADRHSTGRVAGADR